MSKMTISKMETVICTAAITARKWPHLLATKVSNLGSRQAMTLVGIEPTTAPA